MWCVQMVMPIWLEELLPNTFAVIVEHSAGVELDWPLRSSLRRGQSLKNSGNYHWPSGQVTGTSFLPLRQRSITHSWNQGSWMSTWSVRIT